MVIRNLRNIRHCEEWAIPELLIPSAYLVPFLYLKPHDLNMIPQTYLNDTSFLSRSDQLASDGQILLVSESSAAICQWNVLEYHQHMR